MCNLHCLQCRANSGKDGELDLENGIPERYRHYIAKALKSFKFPFALTAEEARRNEQKRTTHEYCSRG